MSSCRQAVWSFGDQLLSSASNFLALLAIARVSTVDEFGTVAVVFAVLVTGLTLARGAFGTQLLLLSARDKDDVLHEARFATGAAVVLGCGIGATIVVGGLANGATNICVPLAVAVPIVMAQDTSRFASIAGGRPKCAAAWDGVWTLLSLLLLIMTWLVPSFTSSTTVLILWTLTAAIALVGLLRCNRLLPRFLGAMSWWKVAAADRLKFGLEAAIGSISTLVVAFAAAILIGTDAAAAIRGAGTVMGPLSVVMTALPLAVIPQALRARYTPLRTWKVLWRLSVGMSIVAIGTGVIGTFLPQAIGKQFLGPSWAVISPLLIFTGVEYAGVVWVSCVFTALRAQGLSAALLKGRITLSASLALSSVVACVGWATARAMAAGLAAAAVVVAVALVAISTSCNGGPISRFGKQVRIRIVD